MKLSHTNNRSNSIKKILIIVVAILAVLGTGYLFIASHNSYWPFVESVVPQTVQKDSNGVVIDSKGQTINTNVNQDSTTNQIPVNEDLTATISKLTSDENNVTFLGNVTGASTNGTCVLTFTNPNDKPVTRTFDGVINGSEVSCGEIAIPSTEFSFLGTWHLTFRYYTNNSQAFTEKDIDIQ